MKKKLFLLDAFALIYRAHFAFAKTPRINSKGINTSAAFGFINTLLDVIQKEKPTHIGIAFDTPEPTFRHIEFEAYKAQREKQPEDITTAIPYIKQIIEGFGIPILMMPGYEADDIVGTVAKTAPDMGFEVYMMTSDKDYAQLVNENVFIYRPAFMGKGPEVYDVAKVLEKFGITSTDQVIDILGLQGDAVDNIPGIPGIGEKTAQKLIEQFGSIENLLANTGQLAGKLKENVVNHADKAILSKRLATIMCDVPFEWNEETLLYTGPQAAILSPIFDELEFRTLNKRIFGEDKPTVKAKEVAPKLKASGQLDLFGSPVMEAVVEEVEKFDTEIKAFSTKNTIDTTFHEYHLIEDDEQLDLLVDCLLRQKEFCFDTETDSLDSIHARLVGISFSYKAHEAFYISIPANKTEAERLINRLRRVFENTEITKIGQNIKFDILVLQNYGVQVAAPFFDTMLAHYVLEPDQRHNMDALSENYLNYTPVSIDELIGKKGKNQLSMSDVTLSKLVEYAGEDADITWQLKHVFEPLLTETDSRRIFDSIENPLINVLADMERKGIKVDTSVLGEYSIILDDLMKEAEQKVYIEAGEEFNLSSPKQLGEILFEKLKLDKKPKKTATGQYATGEEILSKLADEHAIARLILEYRELQKLKSTYVDALPLLIDSENRVHTSYNQAVAATGRLSSTNPNLQNIPVRTDKGKEIRKAFIATNHDFKILSADYSQIELRIMAEFSQDATMLEAFQNGIDIHTSTASKVFAVNREEVTSDMRRKAKMVNFGIIYGISAFGLGQRLSIPRREAADIISAYFREFPGVKTFMDSSITFARDNGFVKTLLGRRRYLRDINSANMTIRGYAERNAINAPIQGTAADMIKIAMITIDAWMKKEKLQSRMILQVHDELIFDAHVSEIDLLKTQVPEFMKTALTMSVPIEIGVGVGDNWLEAH